MSRSASKSSITSSSRTARRSCRIAAASIWRLGVLDVDALRERCAGIAVRQSNVQALFTGDMQLNYSCTVITKMLALCKEAL